MANTVSSSSVKFGGLNFLGLNLALSGVTLVEDGEFLRFFIFLVCVSGATKIFACCRGCIASSCFLVSASHSCSASARRIAASVWGAVEMGPELEAGVLVVAAEAVSAVLGGSA